jgi:hypothetical protein
MTTPADTRPPFRAQWIILLVVFGALALIGALAIQAIGEMGVANAPQNGLIPTVGPLKTVTLERVGVSLSVPEAWKAPNILDDKRFVVSPDGSPDTSPTAGPFLYVVADAQDMFARQLNIPTNLTDPVAQLNLVIEALNRDRVRFSDAAPYRGTTYPAAFTRGVERGNQLMIILLRAPSGRWVYIGAQAALERFAFYESTVFAPAAASLTLTR